MHCASLFGKFAVFPALSRLVTITVLGGTFWMLLDGGTSPIAANSYQSQPMRNRNYYSSPAHQKYVPQPQHRYYERPPFNQPQQKQYYSPSQRRYVQRQYSERPSFNQSQRPPYIQNRSLPSSHERPTVDYYNRRTNIRNSTVPSSSLNKSFEKNYEQKSPNLNVPAEVQHKDIYATQQSQPNSSSGHKESKKEKSESHKSKYEKMSKNELKKAIQHEKGQKLNKHYDKMSKHELINELKTLKGEKKVSKTDVKEEKHAQLSSSDKKSYEKLSKNELKKAIEKEKGQKLNAHYDKMSKNELAKELVLLENERTKRSNMQNQTVMTDYERSNSVVRLKGSASQSGAIKNPDNSVMSAQSFHDPTKSGWYKATNWVDPATAFLNDAADMPPVLPDPRYNAFKYSWKAGRYISRKERFGDQLYDWLE